MPPHTTVHAPTAPDTFLAGSGEMASRIRQHDWASTSLGPPAHWPQSLRSAVSILLPSRAQICLFWGPDLVTIYNDAYSGVLGAKHPRALGQPARQVWREIWDGVLRPLFEGVLRTGEAFWASDHPFFLERYGYPEETFFDISYDPVRDESGGVGGVFCIVSETTGRVVGERRLRTLRDLSAVASEGATTERAFREAAAVLSGNPQDVPFALLFEAREGGPGCAAAAGIAPQPPERWPLEEALRGEVILSGDSLRSRGPLPGRPWPEPARQAVALPIPIAGGAPAGVLVAGISPRRPLDDRYRGFLRLAASHIGEAVGSARALEQQRARAEALAEIDRAKSVFFTNVSHEFRTPLTLMLGPIDELLTRPAGTDPEGDRDLLRVAQRNGRRLLKLVNALLDFSRIEAGRMQLSMEPVELAGVTAELASGFRSAMDKAGLEYTVDCPALSAPVRVDRDAWEKIVFNLVSNAFKYTLQGSVSVSVREDAGRAVLSVRDTGTGIPEAELPHIFKRFHRVQGAQARTHEGTGIGLALVHDLVRLHGGTVTVDSREGLGSTFHVALPLAAPEAAPDAPGTQKEGPARGPSAVLEEVKGWLPEEAGVSDSRSNAELAVLGRVLLADDNADMRAYIQRLLEKEGYLVQAVADGRAALEVLESRRPDLLLADVMMPRMDGLALLQAVRSHPTLNDVAVMLLSARAGEEATVAGLERGADDYLAKPFSSAELRARVRANIVISRLRRAAADREHALRLEAEAQRDRLHAVLAGIRDFFVVLDRDWKFVFVSDSWCAATRVPRDSALGRTVWELFPGVRGGEWDRAARGVMETRQPTTLEYWSESQGLWLEVRLSPWPEGGLSQLALDITERKRTEMARANGREAGRHEQAGRRVGGPGASEEPKRATASL